jgi:hypothetical protein
MLVLACTSEGPDAGAPLAGTPADETSAFCIYLTGHDAVAHDRLTFTKTRTKDQYSQSGITWLAT